MPRELADVEAIQTQVPALKAVAPVITSLMVLFSIFVLLRGHNEPGGGFIGGLIAVAALSIYGIAFGVGAVRRALRFHPATIAGAGLLLSTLSGLASALAEGLTARGHDVRLFGAGAFRFDPAFRQIVDLRGLDPADDPQDPTGQARAEASLNLLHMIAQDGVRRCVTTVVRHADNAPQSAALTSAAQLGLLRVAANEYADLDLRMVQIGGDEVLPALLDELTSDSDEDDIVLIPDQRLVRRLVAVPHGRLAQEAAARRPTGPLAEEEAEIELLLAGAEAPFDVLGRVTSGARAGRLVLTQLPEGMLPQRFLRRPVASLLDLPGDLDWAGDRLLPLLPLAMAHAILRLAGLAQGDRLAVCVGDARMAGALVAVAAMIGAETVQIAGPGDLRGAARRFDAICLDRDDELAEILQRNDNFRIKRYVAKYTINPAIAHGIAHEVGSLEVGKWADIVIWKPAFFGVKPALILKGGLIAMAAMGDPNASIPTPQPVHYRPMFGAFGGAIAKTSLTFVSQAGLTAGIGERFGLRKTLSAVRNIRGVRKQHMVHNSYAPKMEVDAQTYTVRADGQLLTCEPATVLPMAQRYFLF